jgi:hypothetical protein
LKYQHSQAVCAEIKESSGRMPRSRAKALKDIRARLPMRQRAGMPQFKKSRERQPYKRRGRATWRIGLGPQAGLSGEPA